MGKHLIETCGAKVLIQNGQVKVLSEPKVRYCPVYHRILGYERIDRASVKEIVEGQIQSLLYTEKRAFSSNFLITFGASEMLSAALELEIIDCCVIVCEGAGTVIVSDRRLVQGIGARLTGIIKTSPITEIIDKLKSLGAKVISCKARINQVRGVEEAIELGHKRIAVTIAGFESNRIPKLRYIESKERVALYVLSIHNSSLKDSQVPYLLSADLVWSCSSSAVREKVGPKALMQIGTSIPVFALSEKGKRIALDYLMKTNLPILVTKTDLPRLSLENSPHPFT